MGDVLELLRIDRHGKRVQLHVERLTVLKISTFL